MVRHVVPYIRVVIALFRIQLSDSKLSPLYVVAYNQAQSTLLHMIQSGSVCLPLLIGPNVAMNALQCLGALWNQTIQHRPRSMETIVSCHQPRSPVSEDEIQVVSSVQILCYAVQRFL